MGVTAESLLRDVFLPLYPDDAKRDLAHARQTDANPANNPSVVAHLNDAAARFVDNAPTALELAPAELALDFTDASVHRLSRALTRERRDRLFVSGAAGTADNALFNVVVHGAAYVGACVVRAHGGVFGVRRPLWESVVRLASRAGVGDLAIFHWWLKSLADEAFGGGASLADRYRANVEVPCATPESLAIIAAPRRLPKLAKPSYHALHQHLRAHLPELRDLGANFPSAERLDELGFKSLSFDLVGDGRMLVLHGPTKHGLHAFWLTKDGFEKAAFWPCDAFPEPLLRASGEHLTAIVSEGGQTRSHEILWWGP